MRVASKRRPTVIDVANRAGVGASTVSRFLRGIAVRPEIAVRVAKAVEALDYRPDETARALRGGRSRTIGVVLPKISNAFFSQSVQVIEEEARKRGCTVILLIHRDSKAEQAEHLATLRRYRVDGVIITAVPATATEEIRSVLHEVPVVAFDSLFSSAFDAVVLENRESACVATAHLAQHGYKNIACVTVKPDIYSFAERAAAYREELARRHLKPNFLTAPTYEELRLMLAAVIGGRHRPDAILSLSDFATLTTLEVFAQLGLKSSSALPLIGFDDFGFAPLLDPPVTVVRQPIEEMVRCAMNALFRRIEGESNGAATVTMLPGELIRRRSCGCGQG